MKPLRRRGRDRQRKARDRIAGARVQPHASMAPGCRDAARAVRYGVAASLVAAYRQSNPLGQQSKLPARSAGPAAVPASASRPPVAKGGAAVKSDAWCRIFGAQCALEPKSIGKFFFSQSDIAKDGALRPGRRKNKELGMPSHAGSADGGLLIADQSSQYMSAAAGRQSKVAHICATHASLLDLMCAMRAMIPACHCAKSASSDAAT
jgi:hypothetical protein